MGSKELLMPVWNWRKNLGSMIAPATASLLARSLRTLVVRVRQQNESAQRVAEAMLRLSVGLEDADDLIADLEQALG